MHESRRRLAGITQIAFHQQLAHKKVAQARPENRILVGPLGRLPEQGGRFVRTSVGAENTVEHLVGLDEVGRRAQRLPRVAFARFEFAQTYHIDAGNAQGEGRGLRIEFERVFQHAERLGDILMLQMHAGNFLREGNIRRIKIKRTTVVAEGLFGIGIGRQRTGHRVRHGFDTLLGSFGKRRRAGRIGRLIRARVGSQRMDSWPEGRCSQGKQHQCGSKAQPDSREHKANDSL